MSRKHRQRDRRASFFWCCCFVPSQSAPNNCFLSEFGISPPRCSRLAPIAPSIHRIYPKSAIKSLQCSPVECVDEYARNLVGFRFIWMRDQYMQTVPVAAYHYDSNANHRLFSLPKVTRIHRTSKHA